MKLTFEEKKLLYTYLRRSGVDPQAAVRSCRVDG